MAISDESGSHGRFHQNVVIMRHGDRIDSVEPSWITTTDRPWDPPLAVEGHTRAFSAGQNLRSRFSFPITRVFVSPFLRCVQTASEVISGMYAVNEYSPNDNSNGAAIDSSRIRVSIEYGLCEILNKGAIRTPPKDDNWGINISEIEPLLPAGCVDHYVEPLFNQLPKWEETAKDAKNRYINVILGLADKFPHENLLLVTHGEGVGVSVSAFAEDEDLMVYDVEYCACSHLKRIVSIDSFPSKFELIREGQTGIHIC